MSIILTGHYWEKFKAQYPAKEIIDFHESSLRALSAYTWPGNVRELSNIVHKGVLTASSPLVVLDIPLKGSDNPESFEDAVRDFQKQLISKTLKIAQGNKEQSARLLGMSRSTFFRYLSSFGL